MYLSDWIVAAGWLGSQFTHALACGELSLGARVTSSGLSSWARLPMPMAATTTAMTHRPVR